MDYALRGVYVFSGFESASCICMLGGSNNYRVREMVAGCTLDEEAHSEQLLKSLSRYSDFNGFYSVLVIGGQLWGSQRFFASLQKCPFSCLQICLSFWNLIVTVS